MVHGYLNAAWQHEFVHLLLLKGKFKEFISHCEVRLMLFLLALFVPSLTVLLMNGVYSNVPVSLRAATVSGSFCTDHDRIPDG